MDYKKVYFEALERAKAGKPIDEVFPELKESEDERILNALITHIRIYEGDFTTVGVTRIEILDWLEKLKKQKEPHYTKRNALFDKCVENCDPAVMKNVSDKVDESESEERIRKELISFVNKYYGEETKKEVLAYLEKQKEQKPPERDDSVAKDMFIKALERAVEQTKKGYELTDCDKHSWWEDFKAYNEIKPAEWSEDDYNAILIAIDWLQFYRDRFVATEEAKDEITTCVERLKSLRPQPKIEWNNEDKKFIKELCDLLASIAKNNYVGRYYAPDLVSKLQSIHPQPHWKPSEEQMRAVFYASERNDKLGSVLWNLYNDLKKL